MKTRILFQFTCALIVTAFSAQLSTCLAQGSLTPPGPPAATMLTLSQVEPRTPISSVPYTITSSGSYYLTGNFFCGTNAITVSANEVTIDLNGFTLYGESEFATAILVPNPQWDITIRNGKFDYWHEAVGATNAIGSRFENLQSFETYYNSFSIGANSVVAGCSVINSTLSGGGTGIQTGDGVVVSDCTVINNFNHYSFGIVVGRGCVIDSSICTSNFVGIITGDGTKLQGCSLLGNEANGLEAGSDCSVYDCNAWKNGWEGSGIPAILTGAGCTISRCTAGQNSIGISTGLGCTIQDCTVMSNATYGVTAGVGCTISDCTANYNTNGIVANSECTITGCTASANYVDGIQTAFSCLIKGNTCSSNSRYVITGGAGIHVLNSGNRIEGNVLNSNQYGIKADGTENFVIANTARGSGTYNYDLVSGNMVDTIINATASGTVLGSTGGASLGTTDPWANFSF
jgi:parallel beta-helix repeat protein